jgi:hypothetical protein
MYTGKYIKPSGSLISWWRRSSPSQGTTAAAAIGFFLWAQLWPSIAGARELVEKTRQEHAAKVAARDPLNEVLKSTRGELSNLDRALSGKAKNKGGKSLADHKAALKTLRSRLVDADKEVMAGFQRDLDHITAHNLSDVIKRRHKDAVAGYQAGHRQMLAYLDAVDTASDNATLQTRVRNAKDWLESKRGERKHEPLTAKSLPFRVAEDNVRLPEISGDGLKRVLRPGSTAKNVRPLLRTKNRKRPATKKELTSVDRETVLSAYGALRAPRAEIELAANGPVNGLAVVAKDMRECMSGLFAGQGYCDETEDVQITPEIQAKADELGHNPVAIYKFVHDNIEFLPTYGSMQGSDMTLQTKRGNAFDTSSLLIALLRASRIPARYVYGTVQIPSDKAMNWVGGAGSADVAQRLLGQGGIPNLGLVSGGNVVAVQIEHVWVEAFVDFYPSRGSKNVTAQTNPDTWVPLDAAFKHFTYADGVNFLADVPLSVSALLSAAEDGATPDSSIPSVQHLNAAKIKERIDAYSASLRDVIESHGEDPTNATVFGSKSIDPSKLNVLPASLPYRVIQVGEKAVGLGSNSRLSFSYELVDEEGSSVLTYSTPTTAVAGHMLALSFDPASQDDAEAIASYVPPPSTDGTPPDPATLPSSMPAYGIRVRPLFTVDGEIVATGQEITMGAALQSLRGFSASWSDFSTRTKAVVAGEYHAVGLDLAGVSPKQLQGLGERLNTTAVNLQSGTGSVTKHDITGAVLQSVILNYMAANDIHSLLEQRTLGVIDVRLPSFGVFQTYLQPEYSYGVPRSVRFPGMQMDFDQLFDSVQARDGNNATLIAYAKSVGMRASSLEKQIPNELFNSSTVADTTLHAVSASAVTAIALANEEGQTIYSVSKTNFDNVRGLLELDDRTAQDIHDAVSAGLEVVVHARPVSIGGSPLTGYVVSDPLTGSGAYKISTGTDGVLDAIKNPVFQIIAFSVGIILGTTIWGWGLLALGLIGAAASMLDGYFDAIANANCPAAVWCVQTLFFTFALISFVLAIASFAAEKVSSFILWIAGIEASEQVPLNVARACNGLACHY